MVFNNIKLKIYF